MCGIAGYISPSPRGIDAPAVLRSMGEAMQRRGPDDAGEWFDPASGVGFVHRRLSIVDLSPAGRQPMISASERWVITFNGEIYNHRALRREIEGTGYPFRGHSDTEVLLAWLEAHGIAETVPRLSGMFALAAYDRQAGKLWLARDRAGEKPFYYGWSNGAFLFASTLAPLERFPGFRGTVDDAAVAAMVERGCIPAPLSIYREVRKLPPATLCCVDVRHPAQPPAVERYWSLPDGADRAARPATVEELDDIIGQVVGEQLMADRSVGAFLSGGIDSSLITAFMREQSPQPVRTFTIGFHESGFNEAEHAKRIAQHLGTDHTEVYFDAEACLDFIPSLAEAFDEPFADSSQLPTMLVSHTARQHVTVALSGDGGDESFAGYDRYFSTLEAWKRLSRLPLALRQVSGAALRGCAHESVDRWLPPLLARLGLRRGDRSAVSAMRHWGGYLSTRDLQALYAGVMGARPAGQSLFSGAPQTGMFAPPTHAQGDDLHWLMAWDFKHYLADDVLVKVDRSSMFFGLEARAPLLDPRVLDVAWRLPTHTLTDDRGGKAPLRELLARRVPRELFERPKQGFGVPMGTWLRGPLRPWADDLLRDNKLARIPGLDASTVRTRWHQHANGTWDNASVLWPVLMLMDWMDRPQQASVQTTSHSVRSIA